MGAFMSSLEPFASLPIPQVDFPNFKTPVEALEAQKNLLKLCSYAPKIVKTLGFPSEINKAFKSVTGTLWDDGAIKEALLWAKVDAKIATQAAVNLEGKMCTIKNRINMLSDNGSTMTASQKDAEVVVAIDKCEEIYSVLQNKESIFHAQPVASVNLVLSFLPIYKTVAVWAAHLNPNYGGQKHNETQEQIRVLGAEYVKKFYEERLSGKVITWGCDDTGNSYVEDKYNTNKDSFTTKMSKSKNIADYMVELKKLYEGYFNPILNELNQPTL